jgi:hypothetical protein
MSKTGKIITIIIIAIFGFMALMFIKQARGGGMGFFGLFGFAIYLVYQNLFKRKQQVNENGIEKIQHEDEIKLKK